MSLQPNLTIRDRWYAVLDSKQVRRGRPQTFRRLGEDIVFFRDENGRIAALNDRCPHRGVSLGIGRVVDGCVQCPFHGIQFDARGTCRHIPAHGRNGTIPATLRAHAHEVREEHGFVWLWHGESRAEYPPIPFFEELRTFTYAGTWIEWNIDHTRAIEGALDLAHLPFVHPRTIGAGGQSFVHGPPTVLDGDTLRIWIDNRKDTGEQGPVSASDIPAVPAMITFKFPNVWQLYLGAKLRNVLVMAPVDAENTVMYVRTYQAFTRIPLLRELITWGLNLFNVMVAGEDYRVARTVKPLQTELVPKDHLIPADRPIALYLQRRRALIEGQTRMSELYAPLSGRRLKVTSVVRETEDAVSVVLGGQHAAPIAFAPGQFFTVIINKQGTVLRRAYSASSAPGDHHGGVRLTVKRVPGGRVSNDIVDNTVAGEEWTVLGPSGSFSPAPSTSSRHLVLIAGGSGITPMMSIARTLLSTEPMTRLSLIYGNRAYRDIIFHDELRALANSNVGRLTVRLVLEEATAEWVDGKGRLDATVLQNELGAVGAADTYFVCGPGPMVEAARDALRTLGVADAQIRAEAFTQPELRREAQLPSESQRVRLRSKQGETQFTQAPKQTLLEAATRANVAIPFSCTIGACGSCKARVVDGEVRMQEPNCLSQEEKVQGFVLTCVGNATSPTTLELE